MSHIKSIKKRKFKMYQLFFMKNLNPKILLGISEFFLFHSFFLLFLVEKKLRKLIRKFEARDRSLTQQLFFQKSAPNFLSLKTKFFSVKT